MTRELFRGVFRVADSVNETTAVCTLAWESARVRELQRGWSERATTLRVRHVCRHACMRRTKTPDDATGPAVTTITLSIRFRPSAHARRRSN